MERNIQNNLFETICSKENLMLAWRRVENSFKHGNIWYDELELAAYKFNLVNNLEKLSDVLLKGTYQMRPIKPAPYPKGCKKLDKEMQNGDGIGQEVELRIRQSFAINIEDQLVWMAICGVLGPYFEEQMPAWSYGNRLYLNTWKDKDGHWINGVYRTTSVNFYRKWTQGWPLYRHSLSACIKRMAFPQENITAGGVYQVDDILTIEENAAQVNQAFKLKYLDKDYFTGEKKEKLYYVALDLTKFYPHVKMAKIGTIIKTRFNNQCEEFYNLIDAITNFEISYESQGKLEFTETELKEMDLDCEVCFDGLPTGLIVAGALANIYMLELDRKVDARLSREIEHHILHFRYVDDHLMLSDDKSKLESWKNWYIGELDALGLDINNEKTEEDVIDSYYPTPLLTHTLHKISDIAKQPLDLLNNNEFNMVYRDLQMLLVTEFPEQEIKKSTRTSFACTMLSRLVSDINVDYDKIHKQRQKWLSFVEEKTKVCPEKRVTLRSLVFTNEKEYPESLDSNVRKQIGEEGCEIYDSVLKAIGESRAKIQDTKKSIFNLLVYALKETPDKPSMWLKVMDFCIFHYPDKISTIYKVLNMLKNKERQELHPLGHEYIWASLNIHLALRIVKAIYRLSNDVYKNPIMRENDFNFLGKITDDLGVFKGNGHYLVSDSMFILYKAKQLLNFYQTEDDGGVCRAFLKSIEYHGVILDASYWLLWAIERFNHGKPQSNLKIPPFIVKSLAYANQDSQYFIQLLYSCISQVSLSAFGNIDVGKLNLTVSQQDNVLLSCLGYETGYKEVIKSLNVQNDRLRQNSTQAQITLLDWIMYVRSLERKEENVFANAICSEYAATIIMRNIVEFFVDRIEHLSDYSIHPAAITLGKKECIDDSSWEIWLPENKRIPVECKNNVDDTLYRYLSMFSEDYRKEWGVIYGLGILFLQMLTKEYTMPWVFNRPEYGFEWESVLQQLLAKGKVSSVNYKIVAACLSIEDKETLKLRRILDESVILENPSASDIKIDSLEELLKAIKKSIKELRKNQISVANREVRQLVMIKLKC